MDGLFDWPPGWSTLLFLPALFVAFTVHELAHAVVAYLLGDTSQVERKRLSFNPLRHVSWLGMVVFLLVGLGWAKPVWVDYTRFRIKNRAFGLFLVSVAGAAANFLTALLALMGISATGAVVWAVSGASPAAVMDFLLFQPPGPDLHGLAVALSVYMVLVNVLLAVFNLLPFPFFDGFQALMSLIAMIRSVFRGQKGQVPLPTPPGTRQGSVETGTSPARIHFDIGLDYHKEGQLDEAIARYRQATEHDDRFALAYYNLGLAYWAKGRLPLAISSFRAAAGSRADRGLSIQADLLVRELTRAEQDPSTTIGPVPPPLEPGTVPEPAAGAAALDPALARRVWLQLGIGGIAMLVLALAIWVFVTAVTLIAVG